MKLFPHMMFSLAAKMAFVMIVAGVLGLVPPAKVVEKVYGADCVYVLDGKKSNSDVLDLKDVVIKYEGICDGLIVFVEAVTKSKDKEIKGAGYSHD